ncbi:MAG: hypothetical protein Q4B26_15430, partial [Eubacteriales bacterium]|nr:hypothetical protein [Eubacteriales bacterium]
EMEWIYPFQHIVRFQNLTVGQNSGENEVVGSIDDETMLSEGLYYIKELYGELDRVLEHLEESGDISDVTLSRYQEKYCQTAKALRLEKLYCE